MKNFNGIICEAEEFLSSDFEVGKNVLSNQTKTWLKELDKAVKKNKLNYKQCRTAAKQFKTGDFEGAVKTIWGDKVDIETTNSENGGNLKVKTYTIAGYGTFTERVEYKNSSFIHTITGTYINCSTPGYSLGTVISVSGKSDGDIEVFNDKLTTAALAARNTANIYNILFVGIDIPSKFISKPMLRLKKSL
jgi:hypothetical protein